MNGIACPACGEPTHWLSTTNEWAYACRPCDARFNAAGQRMPPFDRVLRFGDGTRAAPYTSTAPAASTD